MSLSIVVAQSGFLGMNIKACLQEKGAFIDSFYRTSSGKLLPAERNSKLLIGDVVESINGTNVLNHDLDNIYKELEVAQRPMEICFKRYKTKFNMKSLLRDSRKSFWINHFLQSVAVEKSTVLANKITLMCIFDCIDELSHLNSCEDIVRLFILESFDTDYLYKIEYDLSTELHHSLFELHESLRSNVEVESQEILKVFRALHSWLSDELLIEFHEPFRVSASAQKMTGWLADSAVYYQLSVRDMLGNAVLWPFLYSFLCQIQKQHMVQEFMSGCYCQVEIERSETEQQGHAAGVEGIARDLLVQGVMVQFYSSQVYHTLLSELEISTCTSSSSVPLVLTERTKVENSIPMDHTLCIKHNAVIRLFRSTELPSGMSKYSYDSKNKCITAATDDDVNGSIRRAIPYTLVHFDTAISAHHHGDIDHSSSSSSSSDGSSSSSGDGSSSSSKNALEYNARDVHNDTHHISAALQSTHTLHSNADDAHSITVGDAILPFFAPTEKLVLLVKSDPATTTSEDNQENCNGADSSSVQTVYDIYASDTSCKYSNSSSAVEMAAIESIVQPESRLFNFVMTNKKGEKVYGSSLVMYKPVEVPIACNHNETENINGRALQLVSLKRVDANSSRSKRIRIFDDNTPTTVDNEEYSYSNNNSNNDTAGNNALTTAANQLLSHISINLYSGMRTAIALGTALPITPIFVDDPQQQSKKPQQLEPLHQASRSQLQSKPPPPTTPRPVAAHQQKQPQQPQQSNHAVQQTTLVTQQQQQHKHKRSHTTGTLTPAQLQQFRVSSPAKMNRYLSSWSSMFQSSLFSAGQLSHTAAPFSGMLRDDTEDEFVIRRTQDVTTNDQTEEFVAVTATAAAAALETEVMQQGNESGTALAAENNADRVEELAQQEVPDKLVETTANNSEENMVSSDSQLNEVVTTDIPVTTNSFAASPTEIAEPAHSSLSDSQKPATATRSVAQHTTLFAAHGVCILTRDPLVDTLRATLSNCPPICAAAMGTHCDVLLQIQRHIEKSGSMRVCDPIANEHCSDCSSSISSPSTRSVSASVPNHATVRNINSSSRNSSLNSSSSTISPSIRVKSFSSLDFDPHVIYDLLSPAHLVTLFLSTLLEYKIIFVSAVSLNISLQLGEFLRTAVKPLKYCHVYAPVLPQSVALELLHCPTPYIVGLLHSRNSSGGNNSNSDSSKGLSCISLDKLPSDAVVVEVDCDRVHVPQSLHKALGVGATLVKRVSQLTRAELWALDSVPIPTTSTGTKTQLRGAGSSGFERQQPQHCGVEATPMALFHSFVAELLSDIRQCCVVFETAPQTTASKVGISSDAASGNSGASAVNLSVHTTDSDTVIVNGGSASAQLEAYTARATEGCAAGTSVSGRQGVIVFDENAYCAMKVNQQGGGGGGGGGDKSSELLLVPRKQEAFFRLLVRSQCFSEHVTALCSGELPEGVEEK